MEAILNAILKKCFCFPFWTGCLPSVQTQCYPGLYAGPERSDTHDEGPGAVDATGVVTRPDTEVDSPMVPDHPAE